MFEKKPDNSDKINKIFMNPDKSLLSMSTNRGYKIFDIRNYLEITENNPYKDYLGELQIAIPYYRTKIIFFTGTNSNPKFKSNDLILWNDEKNSILSRICLKKEEEILEIFLTWNIFFVKLNFKILIFDISTLNLITVVEDIFNPNLVSAANLYNPAILAYVSNLNPSYIKIEKFISDTLKYSFNVSQNLMNLITGFKEIDFIKTSDFGDYICVVGEGANRIHLYSLFDYDLKFCFWRGSKISHTINVSFDLKCKYMSIITDSKTLHIFSLDDNHNKDLDNKVTKKMVENANIHRFSKFHDLQFGNHKQSFIKKIKSFARKNYEYSFIKIKLDVDLNLLKESLFFYERANKIVAFNKFQERFIVEFDRDTGKLEKFDF